MVSTILLKVNCKKKKKQNDLTLFLKDLPFYFNYQTLFEYCLADLFTENYNPPGIFVPVS